MLSLPPENTAIDETSYYYEPVSVQLEDENSIFNYYKKEIRLRFKYPKIARNKVENLSADDNTHVAILRKTYNDSEIIIVVNLDLFEQTVTLYEGTQGKIVDVLCINSTDTCVLKSGELNLAPYSITIIK